MAVQFFVEFCYLSGKNLFVGPTVLERLSSNINAILLAFECKSKFNFNSTDPKKFSTFFLHLN